MEERTSDVAVDPLPPSDGEWQSILIYASLVVISLAAEWVRRLMPPPRVPKDREEEVEAKIEEILEDDEGEGDEDE